MQYPLAASILLAACAAPAAPPAARAAQTLAPHAIGAIQRLHVCDGVYLASQPGAADLALARDEGVKTVIDLRVESEARGFDERDTVAGLGLAYVNLPFGGPAELTDELFARARELLRTAERPLLLHCASANRVGALWIPYRVLDGGLALEQAVSEAKAIGLRSPELEILARGYVARQGG